MTFCWRVRTSNAITNAPRLPPRTVNSTARPPGKACSELKYSSPAVWGTASVVGSPPPAGTCSTPRDRFAVVKKMASFGPHVALVAVVPRRQIVMAGPPWIDTFFTLDDASKKPTHDPSGEKNG